MDTQPEPDATNHLPLPTAAAPETHRRSICSTCHRPNPVCLCHVLPVDPIDTKTKVLILHHPHETNHKLSTTPILTKTLLRSAAITGRRLRRTDLTPFLHHRSPKPAAVYLFPPAPSSPAVDISDVNLPELTCDGERELVLIAFDGTWKHAREMVKASDEFLSELGAIRVCLGNVDESVSGGSIYDSELILRKEPFSGCVSTMEAVARALRFFEPNGVEIEGKLIGILREMVRLQAGFLKEVTPRVRLSKKVKENEKKKEKTEVVGTNEGSLND